MSARAAVLLLLLAACPVWAGVSGTVSGSAGDKLAGVYVALMSPDFALLGDTATDANGAYAIAVDAAGGFLLVQPPTHSGLDGLEIFHHQPRIFAYSGEPELALTLPAAVNLVLEAYDAQGERLRWKDFEARGKHGGQFLYATNTDDEMIPATVWPVHGQDFTGVQAGPREVALPAVLVEPGTAACVSILFWETRGYGKLQLRADNGRPGFFLAEPGATLRINLNAALAETAVAAMEARQALYPEGGEAIAPLRARMAALPPEGAARAAEADAVLAEALRLRDTLELARARTEIPRVRMAEIKFQLVGAENPADYSVSIKPKRRAFQFGAYEGSPYNADAWAQARTMGFELATVLPAWNWTMNPKQQRGAIDRTFGLSALQELGFDIKAHGVVWMQDYGILPEKAKSLPPDALVSEALAHQEEMLAEFDDSIAIWEAMNEPATTNLPGLPRTHMLQLLGGAATAIDAIGKPVLVNNPHEFSFGAKYFLYAPDGTPSDDYPNTYSAFLQDAEAQGLLGNVDIIGLQFYPGFHLNSDFGNQEGPAYTPSYLLDVLDRYRKLGKTVHITELSLPSSYGEGWTSGYWKQPWDEATQAEYAELVYTLAYAHPQVRSLTWWDMSDKKPSVVTGALTRPDGSLKPAGEKIRDLMASWTTSVDALTFGDDSAAATRVFGGSYDITVKGPGYEQTFEYTALEGWSGELTIEAGARP